MLKARTKPVSRTFNPFYDRIQLHKFFNLTKCFFFMGEKFIKVEDGKEVVYEKGGIWGEIRVGELHENWDGSKETRIPFGPNVRVERQGDFSIGRKGEIDGQKGVFEKDSFLGFTTDKHPTFYPDQVESSSGSGSHSSGEYSPASGYSSGGDYGESSHSRSSKNSTFSVLQKIFLTILLGTVLGLGIVHYENYRTISRRIQKPDATVLLEPGPPIPDGNVDYSFDITSTSSPERVVRINHHGSLFGKGKEYTISRSGYPEFYRRLDIDRNGEVAMGEFTRHGVIFEGLTEGIRDGDLESIVNRFLRRADGLCFTEENTYYSPGYKLECN